MNILFLTFIQWFEDQLSQLNASFQDTLDKRTTATNNRLDELNKRITDLDISFENQKKEILKYIDDRGEELSRLLNQFKVKSYEFDT